MFKNPSSNGLALVKLGLLLEILIMVKYYIMNILQYYCDIALLRYILQ